MRDEFLWRYRSSTLFRQVRVMSRPDLFATMEHKARENGIDQRRTDTAFLVLARMILHTGRDLDQLTTEDFLVARESNGTGGRTQRRHGAARRR